MSDNDGERGISPTPSDHVIDHLPQEELMEPYDYLVNQKGKEIRRTLIRAFNLWLNVPDDKCDTISDIIRKLHNASLLIDDIEDGSSLRRGAPSAHIIYGVPATLNCGNYVYFTAMRDCHELDPGDCVKIFLEEMLFLHRGQGQDILWREKLICPSEPEYKQMVMDKTGGLFRLAVRMMQVFSTNTDDFIPLVNDLGLFFQIRDDFFNLMSKEYFDHKTYCEDITEGKFSYPIIHSIKSNPKDSRLFNILKRKTDDIDVKKYCITYMHSTGSFEYTRKVLIDLETTIRNRIQALGGNSTLENLLNSLSVVKVDE